ncbi:MAG TPA: polymorphic toxin-type HINT domain-containing protein [Frankiaceae bacterium]|nr:polymorphic toxin-type HINT domain-containing protein [Frankiaceae bacterium]
MSVVSARRRSFSDRFAISLLAVLTMVAGLSGTLTAVARPAEAAPAPVPPKPAEESVRDVSPQGARAGEEVLGKRTRTSKTFASDIPGRFETKVFSQPIHHRNERGEWIDIDTDLVERDARLVTKSAPVPVDFARNGRDPNLVTVRFSPSQSVTFRMADARTSDAAHTDNKVTYRGVLPGVDLKFEATSAGVKEDIVLASPDVPDTYEFPMRLQGVDAVIDPESGDVVYRDADGSEVGRTPHGFMEDANYDAHAGQGVISQGVTYELVGSGRDVSLRMSLDREWLDDPAREYPVRVDPSYWNSTTWEDDTYVMSNFVRDNAGDHELKVGTYDGGAHKGISFMNYDVSGLNGKVIDSATFYAYNMHSWSCQQRGVGVYRVGQGWGGHTMTGYPGAWLGEQVAWAQFAMGYSSACPAGWAGFDVVNTVRNWTSGAWGQFGLALKVDSVSENDNYAWKKFGSWNWANYYGNGGVPHIDIYWSEPNRAPNVPDYRSPGHGWVGTSSPTLSARYTDPDGNGGNVDFEIYGGCFCPVATSQNQTAYWNPNVGDGVYSWRVRAWDGQYVSAWSDWWTFTVDGSAPAAPSISSSTHPAQTRWYSNNAPAFSFSASDTSGIGGYSYVFDQSATTTPDTVSEGTATSKSYTGAPDGPSYFHVRARNNAGVWGVASHFRVQVDKGLPVAPLTVTSASHTANVVTKDRTIDLTWTAGSDSTSGVAGYDVQLTASATAPAPGGVTTADTSYSTAALSDGSWYAHVRIVDNAGNASTPVTAGPFVIDGTGPNAAVISSSTHASGTWDTDTTASFTWTQPSDASAVTGYSVSFNATQNSDPDETPEPGAVNRSWNQLNITDGTWWFHVRGIDAAGNAGATAHYAVRVDSTAPGTATVTSSTHDSSGTNATRWYKSRTATFAWSGPADTSPVDAYSWTYDQNASTVPDTTADAASPATVTVNGDGIWYFHVRARNAAGLWSDTAAHYAFRVDSEIPIAPTGVTATSGHARYFASSTRTIKMLWGPGADTRSGVAGYATAWTPSKDAAAGTTANKTETELTDESTIAADGEVWFHVRTIDKAGNASDDVAYGPFFIDSNAPSDPIVIASTLLPEIAAQSDELGLEQWGAYKSFPLGGDAAAYVHLRSGNLVAQFDDVSIPGQGLNTVVRHTYNSRRADTAQHDSGLGLGWTLSVADLEAGLEDVEGAVEDFDLTAPITAAVPRVVEGVMTATGYMVEFTDGDGTTHRFTRNGPAGSLWRSPPGVSLRLREVLDANGLPVAYEFVRPDGVVYRAENLNSVLGLGLGAWRITGITDRNGNKLTFSYAKVAEKVRLSTVAHNRPGAGTVVSFAWDTSARLQSITSLPGHSAANPATGTVQSWERRSDFAYDAAGRLSSVTQNAHTDAAGGRRVYAYGYDAGNRLASVTDPRGNATRFLHTAAGTDGFRMTRLTDRRAADWTFAYQTTGAKDSASNTLTKVTSPVASATTYELSPRGEVGGGDRRITGGNIRRISDQGADSGQPVTTRYDWVQNRMVTTTDGAGVATNYEYNDLGLVTKVTEPVPNDTGRADLPPGAATTGVESVIDWAFTQRYPADKCTDPPADAAGTRVTKVGTCYAVADMTRTTSASNYSVQKRITEFDVDTARGNLRSVTQRYNGDGSANAAKDRTTTFTHYTSGALKAVDGPRTDVADVTTYGDTADAAYGGYDRTGQPLRIVDALGKAKTFGYTPYGQIAKSTDRDNRVTLNKYDGRDNLVEVVDAEGDADRYAYDANDVKTKETSSRGVATATVDDYTTFWCYDAGGLLVKLSKPGQNGAAPGVDTCATGNLSTRVSGRTENLFSYFLDGTKSREVDALGGATDYEYYLNRALKLTREDTATNVLRAETLHTYDAAGRVRTTTGPIANDGGGRPVTETTYTPSGEVARKRQTTAAGGMSTVLFAHNAHGEVIQTKGPRSIDGRLAEENNTVNAFGEVEKADRLSKVPGGAARPVATAYQFDKGGNQTGVGQPTDKPNATTGETTQLWSVYEFDELGRIKRLVREDANPGKSVTYTYTGEGQQLERADLHNGSLVRLSTYTYNADNTQQSLVVHDQAKGTTLASCNFEAGADPRTGYDADGNLLVSRTVSGTTGCSGGTVLRRQTFAYDGRNFLENTAQTVRAPSGTQMTRTQSFTYNADGDALTATHDGRTIRYSYSVGGWLESMTDWRDKTSSITYLPSGAPKTQNIGGAASGTFGYHPDGSVANLTWRTANATAGLLRAHTGLVYDEGGLRKSENVEVTWPVGSVKPTGSRTASYEYDLLDRLTSWTSPFVEDGGTAQPDTAYVLDDGGNITKETTQAGATVRSTATSTYVNGRLTSKSTVAGATTTSDSFTYNGLGEETRRSSTANGVTQSTTTSHDPMGHTARVDDSGTTAEDADVDYVYDTADRLISRTETKPGQTPEVTLFFYWGTGGSLAEETDGNGATRVRYVVDNEHEAIGQQKHDLPSPQGGPETPSTFRWMVPDTAGNPATYVDDNGLVAEQAAFDPYGKKDKGGEAKDATGGAKSTVGFQGAITDKATGNIVLGARLYDPASARFTTPDMFVASALDMQLATDSLTGNRYLFAAANPVSFYEDGHWPKIKLKIPSPLKALKSAAKAALPALSFVPVVGTAIDVVSAATGRDLLNGGRKLSGAERAMMLAGAAVGMVPGAGTAAKAGMKAAAKLASKGKTVKKVGAVIGKNADDAGMACKINSFTAGTLVLLADGTSKPIEEMTLGDEVLATDPETGETAAKPVTDLIVGEGLKNLVDVTIDGEVVTATAGHPFWVEDRGWVDATDLLIGDLVLEADGDLEPVVALRRFDVVRATVFNLTVADIHTYYVQFGEPVLVHNCKRVGGETAATKRGREAHEAFNVLMDEFAGYSRTRAIVGSKLRPDGFNRYGAPVELKPDHKRGIRRGKRQLEDYERAAGKRPGSGELWVYSQKSNGGFRYRRVQ